MSKYRPTAPIVALTTNEAMCRRVAAYWGVIPALVGEVTNTDEMVQRVASKAQKVGLVKPGDVIIVTAAAPVASMGETNMMELHRVK
jgi:pyruvate kinase